MTGYSNDDIGYELKELAVDNSRKQGEMQLFANAMIFIKSIADRQIPLDEGRLHTWAQQDQNTARELMQFFDSLS
jgi:hypothetical protein